MAKDTVDVTPVVDAPVAAPAKADTCTDCTGYCQVCGANKSAE